MAIDELTSLKWVGGIIAIVSLPFAWVHARQNRTDIAVGKIADHAKEIAESVARMEVHQKFITRDLDDIKIAQNQRRAEHS